MTLGSGGGGSLLAAMAGRSGPFATRGVARATHPGSRFRPAPTCASDVTSGLAR